jgi:hypothetical protein
MTLKEKFKLGRKFAKQGNINQADKMFDLCIVQLSKETINGATEIEGVDINLWKTRVWTAVEKAGLLPD